jgi:hypothetical protein
MQISRLELNTRENEHRVRCTLRGGCLRKLWTAWMPYDSKWVLGRDPAGAV